MPFLNYHHLMYFWTVAREGGVARAAEKLHLSSPTISAQIHELETVLSEKLFERRGRSLVLTEMGQVAYQYADDIFNLGRELLDAVKLSPESRPQKLTVGISDALPKALSAALLEPALQYGCSPGDNGDGGGCSVVVHEGNIEALLAELAAFKIDLILTDIPLAPGSQVRAYNHLLCEGGVSFFAANSLAAKYTRNFPRCLDGAPVFLPSRNNALRRSLEQYFDTHGIHPRVLGECDDAALLRAFGESGRAIFPASSVMEHEFCRHGHIKSIGRVDTIRERYYAISPERKVKHPAVVAICSAARKDFFH